MSLQRLTERIAAPFAGCRVNRESGTISGVLICGTESANGRDYPAAVLRRDHALYEGRPVNCDHGRESTVDRRLGWFSGVAPGADGRPRGTLNLLKSHPMFERVMEAAERNPALYGFSHVAMCETRRSREGREVVEAIKSVESIDLVADPATTKGLFEAVGDGSSNQSAQKGAMEFFDPWPRGKNAKKGKGKKGKKSKKEGRDVATGFTIKQLAGWIARHSESKADQIIAVKRLSELDDGAMGDVPAMDAEPVADMDPADGIKDAFSAACMHLIGQALDGEMDPKEALSKLKRLIASHGEVNGDGGDDSEGEDDGDYEDDGGDDAEMDAEEGKAPSITALREAKAACVEAGWPNPTLDDLEILAAAPKAARPALAARLARTTEGAGAEKAKAATRAPGSGTAGRVVVEAKAPADAKAFAALIVE